MGFPSIFYPLPQPREIKKGVCAESPIDPKKRSKTFGAILPVSGSMFTDSYPGIVQMILEQGQKEILAQLPAGWIINCQGLGGEGTEYVSYWFDVPHALQRLRIGNGVPREIGELLSGYLQLGEALNFRNFQNYLHFRKLKYLPFLITPETFRFFVYKPTRENILATIPKFQKVLEEIQPLVSEMDIFLWDVYALVRLDEVQSASTFIEPAMNDLLEIIDARLKKFRRSLGFVYTELPGPQDVEVIHRDSLLYQNGIVE